MQIGFLGLLGLLFIGLKLGGVLAWSWWLVLLPLYAVPLLIVGLPLFVGGILGLFALVTYSVAAMYEKWSKK